MLPYLDHTYSPAIGYQMKSKIDKSDITIIHSDMTTLLHNSVHRHKFYELALIIRGSCELRMPNMRTPLIAGDLILIHPEQPHLFRPEKNTHIVYCQFERILSECTRDALIESLHSNSEEITPAKRIRTLRAFEQESGETIALPTDPSATVMQGMIHLSRGEVESIHQLYNNMLNEQTEQPPNYVIMKQILLDQLLISAARSAAQHHSNKQPRSSWQKDFINTVLSEIETNYAQDLDFKSFAAQGGITLSHFRSIFRKQTGLSPIDYLNRTRVLYALKLLQTTDLAVSEISAWVGISDSNYFTRLFKKVTGYPPRYFKSISR